MITFPATIHCSHKGCSNTAPVQIKTDGGYQGCIFFRVIDAPDDWYVASPQHDHKCPEHRGK